MLLLKISRTFFLLRSIYARNFLDISLAKISEAEAINLIHRFDPSMTVTINETVEDKLATWYDKGKNEIKIHPMDLDEETILHELGHHMMSQKPGSANYIFDNSETYTYDTFFNMEIEAWEFAESHSSKPWGKSQKNHVRYCLDVYRSRPAHEYGNY